MRSRLQTFVPMPDDLTTSLTGDLADVASFFQVGHVRTVKRYCTSGRLSYFKHSGHWLFGPEDVFAFWRKGRVDGLKPGEARAQFDRLWGGHLATRRTGPRTAERIQNLEARVTAIERRARANFIPDISKEAA